MGIDPEKVKKQKKAKKEGDGKKRNKTPWKAKQVMRVERALKSLTKLSSVLVAAKAPNIEPALAQNALAAVSTLSTQVNALPADWKPAKGHAPGTSKKPGIGSFVSVKTELTDEEKKFYTHFPTTLFTNAEVVADDGRNWIVKCGDGITRVLKKKHAVKYTAPVAPANAAA